MDSVVSLIAELFSSGMSENPDLVQKIVSKRGA